MGVDTGQGEGAQLNAADAEDHKLRKELGFW